MLNTRMAQLQIFFCLLLLRLCLVSSETSDFDRGRSKAGLRGSSAQHANVYLRSRCIHVCDMWRTYIGCVSTQ